MDKNEYLVARVGDIRLGVYCRDVENVYCSQVKLVRLFYQDKIFRGLASINGNVMQVLDLRKRIGMEERLNSNLLTMISFNTGGNNSIAVIVDEIIGMQRLEDNRIIKNDKMFEQRSDNVGLLFPTVAIPGEKDIRNSKELIHILDSTYLDKTAPITEECGELELF